MVTTVPELHEKLLKKLGIETASRQPGHHRRAGSRTDTRKVLPTRRPSHRQARSPARSSRPLAARATSRPDSLKRKREHGDGGTRREDDRGDSPDGPGPATDIASVYDEQLARDDAEVAALERKLKVKRRKRSPAQSWDEELDDIFGTLDGDDGHVELSSPSRPSIDDDEELRSSEDGSTGDDTTDDGDDGDDDDDDDNSDNCDDSDNGDNGDDCASEMSDPAGMTSSPRDRSTEAGEYRGPDSGSVRESAVVEPEPRTRENPYCAPVSGRATRYVPPAQRIKDGGGDLPGSDRLRKQIQGLINRITDDNVLSIVQSFEKLYRENARGEVTALLTDGLMAQVCQPQVLPDPFFVLTGGFVAAICMVVGISFGSHLLRRLAADFRTEYESLTTAPPDDASWGKGPSNLLALLTELYVFGVVGHRLLLDYIDRLLSDLTEVNAELILRIIRMGGRLLRRDDPAGLQRVVGSLNKTVAQSGLEGTSARTRYMIEAINDLKTNKARSAGGDLKVVSEQVQRMKKRLGELRSRSSRRLDGAAAMGVSLRDIEGADVDGEWWLVGASVRSRANASSGAGKAPPARPSQGRDSDQEDMDMILPDYPKLGREQGLSARVQIAIFTAVMSATDVNHGYRQVLALKLDSEGRREISRVLTQCVGGEMEYNPYYTMVATRLCSNNRIRFGFQDRLWAYLRDLGEPLFGEDEGGSHEVDSESTRTQTRTANVARLFGSLMAGGALSVAALRPLGLHRLQKLGRRFVACILATMLAEFAPMEHRKREAALAKVFESTRAHAGLAAGIHFFIRKHVVKSAAREIMQKAGMQDMQDTIALSQQILQGIGDGSASS